MKKCPSAILLFYLQFCYWLCSTKNTVSRLLPRCYVVTLIEDIWSTLLTNRSDPYIWRRRHALKRTRQVLTSVKKKSFRATLKRLWWSCGNSAYWIEVIYLQRWSGCIFSEIKACTFLRFLSQLCITYRASFDASQLCLLSFKALLSSFLQLLLISFTWK